jgi:hypothetical protein
MSSNNYVFVPVAGILIAKFTLMSDVSILTTVRISSGEFGSSNFGQRARASSVAKMNVIAYPSLISAQSRASRITLTLD